jgi:hypothetical protein
MMASKFHKFGKLHVIQIYLHWHHMTLICLIIMSSISATFGENNKQIEHNEKKNHVEIN